MRAKAFLREREANQITGRRNSFSNHCSFARFFNLVRVPPTSVFAMASLHAIDKVLQVAAV